MPSPQYPQRKLPRAILWTGLVFLAFRGGMAAADDPASPSSDSADGRRLILVYGAKRVDLRSPPPPTTAVEPTPLPEVPWGIPFRDVNQRPSSNSADGVRHGAQASQAAEASQAENSSSASRGQLEYLDPAEQQERRALNVLRAPDAPASGPTRLPAVEEETPSTLPIAAGTPPPSRPAPVDAEPISLAESLADSSPSASAESTMQLRTQSSQPLTDPASSTSATATSVLWLEHRLTWLIIALFATVLCLIVLVLQLLATMGRLNGKLVPTIRLEMSNPPARTDSATHEPTLPSSHIAVEVNVPPDYQQRAGAVVDFANQSIPAEMFRGEFEKQRQAELEQRKSQELAMMQDIFQDNLALRQRLRTQAA